MALELNDEVGRPDRVERRPLNVLAFTRSGLDKYGPSKSVENQIAAAEAWCSANGAVLVAVMEHTRCLERFVREVQRLNDEGITVDALWPGGVR